MESPNVIINIFGGFKDGLSLETDELTRSKQGDEELEATTTEKLAGRLWHEKEGGQFRIRSRDLTISTDKWGNCFPPPSPSLCSIQIALGSAYASPPES